MKTEPAIILGAVQAIIVLAVSFGLELTTEQTAAIFSIAAIVLSIVTRQLVTPNGKPSKKKTTAALIVFLALLAGCGGAFGTAAKVAHGVGDALEIIDAAATGADKYFARHPSLENEEAIADAIKLVREAIESEEKDKAVQLYKDMRALLDETGITSATPPDGGAENEDAPKPEPLELPTADEFGATL